MPRGYQNMSLKNDPYVGIDVDYFDKKALEQQQRHDTSREMYSKFSQDVANQSYLNPAARNEYLQQQNQNFEDVLNKYSGNLSAGYQDILGAIEESKNSPYHNLNKRHVEQSKLQQELNAQYGSEAIDLSRMPNDLYTKKSDGTVEWADPNSIGANVVKADDYAKKIEDMLKETSPQEWAKQSKLSGGSGNIYYLISEIQSGKHLGRDELMQIAKDPAVQQALRANATTSSLDTRNVPGMDVAYKDMFADPDKLAQYIYGNIQDKYRNDVEQKYIFPANIGAEMAQKHANDKKLAEYTEYLKKNNEAGITLDVPLDNQKVNGSTKQNIDSKITTTKVVINGLANNIDGISKDINATLGTPLNHKVNTYGDVLSFTDNNGALDNGKIQRLLNKKYGLDYNAQVDPNSEIGQKIADDMTHIQNKYMEAHNIEQQRRSAEKDLNDYNNFSNKIDETVYNQSFDQVRNSELAPLLNKYGITNAEQLKAFTESTINSNDIGATNAKVAFNNIKNRNLSDGVKMDQIYYALANESEKSMTNRFNKVIGDKSTELGTDRTIGMFLNSQGKNLGSYTMVDNGRGILHPLGSTISLDDKLEKLKSDGYTTKLESYVASPDGETLKYHLKIKVFKGGKEVPEQEIFIPNAKLDPRYKNLELEMTTANQTEAINGYLTQPGYKRENIARANIMTGQAISGDKINDATLDLSNPQLTKVDRTIEFTLPSGQQTAIKIVKDVDGLYGLVGIDGKTVMSGTSQMPYKTPNVNDIKAAAETLVGEAAYMYNPNLNIERQRIPRSTFDSNTSYSNYAFSKNDFSKNNPYNNSNNTSEPSADNDEQ